MILTQSNIHVGSDSLYSYPQGLTKIVCQLLPINYQLEATNTYYWRCRQNLDRTRPDHGPDHGLEHGSDHGSDHRWDHGLDCGSDHGKKQKKIKKSPKKSNSL